VRTQGCDEFSLQLDFVSHHDQSGAAKTACVGWCQLKEGDTLETDGTGQAELNFSDCWPGHLYMYQASTVNTLVSSCTKADLCPEGNCENPPTMCVPNGAIYADKCAGEFNPVTGNARIIKASASYLVTYNKDAGDVTTVVVTDGAVYLRPLAPPESSQASELAVVNAGQFFFTMPDATLHGVGGLEPRVAYSVEQLPQMAYELGLQNWLVQAGNAAVAGGYLPTNWPAEFLPQTPSPTPCISPPNWVKIIVQPGDTLRELAHTYDSSVKGLMEANCLTSDQLVVGSELYVPYIPTPTPTRPPPPTWTPEPFYPPGPTITPTYWYQ
jgi:LysM repeat protein